MAKALNPDQCGILHQYYPISECCLCNANARIRELQLEVGKLKSKAKRKRVKANP
ncbi:hypothetical protein LCGC14_2171270 [marine sediment metagenome]|uniref:Uncharacterized protein n=1 Tax=marine sediment metagenome TaxID=412755 RepID=A0A0F9GL10_9ZZZZ